ncbi:Ig-like domain repeat protein, partial [Kitasatospora sp. NPDC001660]
MPLPSGSDPRFIATTPDSLHAYVTELGLGQVQVIDTTSNTITATVTGFTSPSGIAITPDGLHAYVDDFSANTVSVVDTTSNTVVGSPIPVGNNPYGNAITPDGHQVYVGNVSDATVSVIDTTTNTVSTTVTVGSSPYKLGMNPDGKHVYVGNFSSNNVSVIDTTTNTVTDTFTVTGPFGIAITPVPAAPTVTTTLTGSPTPSLFGHPVTLTDTVCPNGGSNPTPTGTVTFTDGGATLGTAPLTPGGGDHCAQAQLTWSNLLPGSHTLTAQYSGDATYPAPAAESATQTVNCARTVTGSVASVVATGESTCVLDATVRGSVSAGAGTALFIGNSTVQGSVSSFGSTLVGVCGTTVNGSLAVTGASRFVVIGDPGD